MKQVNFKILGLVMLAGLIAGSLFANIYCKENVSELGVFQFDFIEKMQRMNVQGVIEGLLTVFNGVLIFLNGVFAGDWAKAWQGMKDIFSGIVQSIKSIFLGVIEVIKGRINGITSQINNVAQKMSSLPIIRWNCTKNKYSSICYRNTIL